MNVNTLFQNLWQDYIKLSPSALEIHNLFLEREKKVLNDHVAFRTFQSEKVGLEAMARHFEKHGYKAMGDYEFKEKKLFAKHYQHEDENLPKVFISELLWKEFSQELQDTVQKLLQEIEPTTSMRDDFCYSGVHWKINYETYQKLVQESEYAGWLYAFGFRANHFTVNINALKSFTEIQELNEFVESKGFELNTSGGKVKGSPEELLEQSSTKAKEVEVNFEDGTHSIRACYYEFAKRYPDANDNLYQGFIAASADKIFESTDR